MNLWNQPGVPKKGWTVLDVSDLGEERETGEVCKMCGQEDLRYVFSMMHPEYASLQVGCVCAEKMTEDYVTPQKKQNELKNTAARRRRALSRRAFVRTNCLRAPWQKTGKGEVRKISGYWVTVYQRAEGWGAVIQKAHSKKTYATIEEARGALFDEVMRRIDNGETP